MSRTKLNIDSYADFKTAIAAFGEPIVFYRFLNSDASLQIWAFSDGFTVGSNNINSDTPSAVTLLADFPMAHGMTSGFGA